MRHVRVVEQPVYDPLHAARQRHAGVGYAEPHRIAHSDLDGNAAFLRELHKLGGERHHKPVEIGAGNIFKMAARTDPVRKRAFYDPQIFIERLRAR